MNTMNSALCPAMTTQAQFRQSFIPADTGPRGDARHWMLDFEPGRDLLKVAARKANPDLAVPLFGKAENLDDLLDAQIDRLGLRETPAPVTAVDTMKMNAKFFKMMVLAQLGRL